MTSSLGDLVIEAVFETWIRQKEVLEARRRVERGAFWRQTVLSGCGRRIAPSTARLLWDVIGCPFFSRCAYNELLEVVVRRKDG